MIRITHTRANFEREPMIAPFGFKGAYNDEIWQVAVGLSSAAGHRAVGLGVQSVLWSDADVFRRWGGAAGDCTMFLLTARALRLARDCEFSHPPELLDRLLPDVLEYGRRVTGKADLRPTFALNALVAVDLAAWLLWAQERGVGDFDAMIPASARPALPARHRRLAAVPLMSYGVPLEQVVAAVEQGYFLLKIKIGADPDRDGDPEKMLEWDCRRLGEIHEAVKDRRIAHTADGRIPYYLDANGRYESKDRLQRLLAHAERIGALERILILEEPFPEAERIDVSDLPVTVAADESAHSAADVLERIDLGYGAIALKPIAKTLSETFRMAAAAHGRGVPCFCADLTVNPVMVEWNKLVAARLAPLGGLQIGLVETNGHQHYRNWARMRSYHPCPDAPWSLPRDGLFELDDDFYARSGGIFLPAPHYESLVT
jgi:L-alanine-DL-glutamate epimerase-like enolase superfamily enzyme